MLDSEREPLASQEGVEGRRVLGLRSISARRLPDTHSECVSEEAFVSRRHHEVECGTYLFLREDG